MFGVGKEHIEEAFKALNLMNEGDDELGGKVSREHLLYSLENLGACVRPRATPSAVPPRARAPRSGAHARGVAARARGAPRVAGEALSRDDLEKCLKALTGKVDVDDVLPETLGAGEFAETILGFEDVLAEEDGADVALGGGAASPDRG